MMYGPPVHQTPGFPWNVGAVPEVVGGIPQGGQQAISMAQSKQVAAPAPATQGPMMPFGHPAAHPAMMRGMGFDPRMSMYGPMGMHPGMWSGGPGMHMMMPNAMAYQTQSGPQSETSDAEDPSRPQTPVLQPAPKPKKDVMNVRFSNEEPQDEPPMALPRGKSLHEHVEPVNADRNCSGTKEVDDILHLLAMPRPLTLLQQAQLCQLLILKLIQLKEVVSSSSIIFPSMYQELTSRSMEDFTFHPYSSSGQNSPVKNAGSNPHTPAPYNAANDPFAMHEMAGALKDNVGESWINRWSRPDMQKNRSWYTRGGY